MTVPDKPMDEASRQSDAELRSQAEALTRFNHTAAGRDLRMLRLEQEVNELCQRQGEAARYPVEIVRDMELTQAESLGVPPGDSVMPLAQALAAWPRAALILMEEADQARQATEKFNAEFRESEERYRMIFESLDEGFCVIEKVEGNAGAPPDFCFVEANPAFAVQSGVSDVVGKTLRQLFGDESTEWIEMYDAVCTSGKPIRFERELVSQGRVLELYAFRVSAKTPGRVAINFQDITARKQAEQLLRQNHDTFFNLIENAPFGLYVVDAQFRLRQVSTASQKVFSNIHPLIGRDFEEVLRLVWTDPFVSDALGRFRHTLQTGEPYAAPNTTQQRQNIPDVESYDWKIERIVLPDGQFGVVCYFYDITERIQAGEALRQRTAQFETLLNEAPLGVYLIDADFRVRQVNPTALPVFGNMPELIGRDFAEVMHILWPSAQADEAVKQFRHTLETGEACFVPELIEKRADRQTTEYYEWQINRIPLLDGRHGVVCYFRDISERVLSLQKIRESEERYRNLFNSIDEGFCVIDMIFDEHEKPIDFRFLEVNPAFEKQSGISEATGRRMREIAPDIEAHWSEIRGKVALTGEPVRYVNESKALNDRWFDIYAFRIGGPESRKVAVIFTNIAERKLAEKALRESEERLRLAAEAAHFGMYDRDLGGAYFHISAQIKQMLGYKSDAPLSHLQVTQMLGYESDAPLDHLQVMSHIHPDDRLVGLAAFQRACDPAGDGNIAVEQRIVRRDGSVRWIASVGRVLFEDGVPKRSIGFWIDITERRRLQRETLEQAQALADLDRRKDEFLAMLSHELRNPLAALSNAVQLLRLQKNEAPLQQEARHVIERQLGQLKHLVDDLLEVSRITSGRVQLRQEQVSVGGIVERAVETAQPLIVQRRHELKVSLPPAPIFLQADAARLEQVLVNLLTNAAKYTDEGGRIWLSVEHEGDTAVLRVRDTGIGIAPELLPRIFDLFTQAERSLDRSQGGLGIGLCLVQRLVELHGGSVEAHSVLGQGSEFVVRLPLMLTALPASPAPAIETAQPPDSPAKGCRVLVVDDNMDAAQSLAMLLKMSGHEVQIAYDGPSALEAALAYRPDVMLLDIGLPGLTGYEVAEQIRREATLKNTVLVALTGYGRETDRKLSQEAGFDHHLVKPADFADVQKILLAVSEKAT